MRRLQLPILLLLTITCRSNAQDEVDQLLVESNPAIQKQLEAVASVFRPSDDLSDNVEALREIGKLKELADDEKLVKQVAIFSMAPGKETQPMTAGAILYYLQIRSRVTIRTLAPYLDAENTQLRSFVRDCFQGRDYKDYLTLVRWSVARGEEIPAPFIRYIFERGPGEALLVFAKGTADVSAQLQAMRTSLEAHQQGRELTEQERTEIRQVQAEREIVGRARRQIVLAEHIVSNAIWLDKHGYIVRFNEALPEAKEGLATLMEGEWWARLYVGEIMRRHPKLRQENLLQRLSQDDNELVKEAVNWRNKNAPAGGAGALQQ